MDKPLEVTFPRSPERCCLCDLGEYDSKNPDLPTRALNFEGLDRCILFVGEAPGAQEDQIGENWHGWSGQLLQRFIERMEYKQHADIYLGNACRCRPGQNDAPTNGQINRCRPKLIADIELLLERYKEVIVVACGSKAVYGLTKKSRLGDAFRMQGERLEGLASRPVIFFATYHPAILHRGRQPGKIKAVEAHLTLLRKYLVGEFVPEGVDVTPEIGIMPPELPWGSHVVLDIETYGILQGSHQSVFHPAKSKHIDGVDYGKQIVTVGFGWREGEKIRTTVLEWGKHRTQIHQWLFKLAKFPYTVVGQNVKFDLLYLWYNDVTLRPYINPCCMRVDDTMMRVFLLYEQFPEKGLKELSNLLGIANYDAQLGTSSMYQQARSASDPRLHQYNALDCWATLRLYEEALERTRKRYGADSPKLKPLCSEMINAVLWDTIRMEQVGVALHVERLQEVRTRMGAVVEAQKQTCSEKGVILEGEGKVGSLREFMERALQEAGLWDDARVMRTKKQREISYGKENVELARAHAPEGETKEILGSIKRYQDAATVINSFVKPLLDKPIKGIVHKDRQWGLVYPSWYPIPAEFGNQHGESGGTIQGRLSAQRPAAQNFPPEVDACLEPMIGYDLSQIELRVAALVSGDVPMLEEYRKGASADLHTATTCQLYPGIDTTAEGFKKSEQRQLGKTVNFLVIYRGGGKKLQETARRDLGLELGLEFCYDLVRRWYRAHPLFEDWQRQVLDFVERHGYYLLPTGWSRFFGIGKAAIDSYLNEIANFPVQTTAAQLMQSAHFEVEKEIIRRRLRSRVRIQRHDALWLRVPADEEAEVDAIMEKYLTYPPLMARLEDYYGRSVPILYERTKYNYE